MLAAYGHLAALRDDTPAVLDVARFPADGKNKTALLSAQGLPAERLPVSAGRRHRTRNGAGKTVTGLRHSYARNLPVSSVVDHDTPVRG